MSKEAGTFIIESVHTFQSPISDARFTENHSSSVETNTLYIPLQLSQDTRFNRVNDYKDEAQTQAMNLDDSLCSEEENGQEGVLLSSVCTNDQPHSDSSHDTTSMVTKHQTTPVCSPSLGLQQNSDSHQTTNGPKKIPCFGKKKNPKPQVSITPVVDTENSSANTNTSGISEDPTSNSIGLTTSVLQNSEPVAIKETVKKPTIRAKTNGKAEIKPCTKKAVADPSNPSSTSESIPKKPRKVLSAEEKARNAAEREQKKLDKKKEIERNRIEREWTRELEKMERQMEAEGEKAEREKMKRDKELKKESQRKKAGNEPTTTGESTCGDVKIGDNENQEKCKSAITKEDPTNVPAENSKKQEEAEKCFKEDSGINISEVLTTIVPETNSKSNSTGEVPTMESVLLYPERLLRDLESPTRDSESATSAEFPMDEDPEINVEESDSDQSFVPSELASCSPSKKKIKPFKPPNLTKQKPKPKTNSLKTKSAAKSFKPPKNRKRKAAFGGTESDSDSDSNQPAKQSKPNLSGPVWVQCDNIGCQKWRKLADCGDPSQVPEFWICSMNTNTERNACSAPEEDWKVGEDSEEFVESVFVPGSIVWAKMDGYPWWPAMIEEDPDHESFYKKRCNADSNVPVKYHVVFFDTPVSRGWIHSHSIVLFTDVKNPNENSHTTVAKKHKKPLQNSMKQAHGALANFSLEERLEKFGFSNRYTTKKRKASDNDTSYIGKKVGYRKPLPDVVNHTVLLVTPSSATEEMNKISASEPINVQSEE